MTLGKTSYLRIWLVCLVFGYGVCSAALVSNQAGRRYGPTSPSGYYVRLEPSVLTMSHTQRPQLTVTVHDASGQPVDDVFVGFAPSEGSITTGASRTRGGAVIGTFHATTGSDSPRTAFVVVTVEDVDITVFIDIVPAVFGR